MKKYYLLLLITYCYSASYGQVDCMDGYHDLNYAYSHIKSAYEANNFTHLKHYSTRSLESFKKVQKKLENCGCMNAYNLAFDAVSLLEKAENTETFEDGRFFVKRVREIAKQTFDELEQCTVLSSEDEALLALKNEQLKLEEQHAEIKRKEEQLKRVMEEREEKEIAQKKELLIKKNETAINLNIKAYNEILDSCECNSEMHNETYDTEELRSKDLKYIKNQYLNINKTIATEYLKKLNECRSR